MGLEKSFISKNAYKIAQNSFKNFKLSIQNVVSTKRDFAKKMAIYVPVMAVLGSLGIVVKYRAASLFVR